MKAGWGYAAGRGRGRADGVPHPWSVGGPRRRRRPIDLGPFKQRALLALLLFHAGRVLATDRILEDLWGDDALGKENALWVYISRLRAALEPDRAPRAGSSVLVTRDHGYVLDVDADAIDARRFEQLAQAGWALVRDDPVAAAETLRTALDLWRGAPLQEFTYEAFATAEITRLERLRLDTVENRIEADLRCGLANELVVELEGLVEESPLRERPVSQLVLALYRSGRQAEALRALQAHRSRLGEELGLEPSPELRRLEEQVLLHDERLRPPRLATLRPSASNADAVNPFKGLRAFGEADVADFFGRERLVADLVARLVRGERLLSLVGPSGSGKSSALFAGLVPVLRKEAVAGSDSWLVASMVPGSYPMVELEAALLRASVDPPDSLAEQLTDGGTGLLRAVLRILPDDSSRLLLVVDQFEELFTLVGDLGARERFLSGLLTVLDDPRGRVTVVVSMRADAYHLGAGPPRVRASGWRARSSTSWPLRPDELEAAAEEPAARNGVRAGTGAAGRVPPRRDRPARFAAHLPVHPDGAVRPPRRRHLDRRRLPSDGRRARRRSNSAPTTSTRS